MWRELEGSRDSTAPEEGKVESRARFLVDASFPSRGVELLRSAGAQVWTSADCDLLGQTESAHVAYALERELVLLTCNPDFLDLQRFPLQRGSAIFVFHFGSGSVNDLRRALRCLAPVLGSSCFSSGCTVEASSTGWARYHCPGNGTRQRRKYRLWHGKLQEWLGESCETA
ncbi:DUF5615 family PIN-like protein [Dyella japonica]|jgi:predicted nuclease of predicted toxin-antitoxin system|nr:DUF5615 family PIN-like protein [Dyella japonica]